MSQDPSQTRKNDDDKISVSGTSFLDLKFLDEEDEARTVTNTTKPVKIDFSTPDHPSIFMNPSHNVPESRPPGKLETATKKLFTESPRRK